MNPVNRSGTRKAVWRGADKSLGHDGLMSHADVGRDSRR